jgi:hypothetical protein
MNVIDNESFRVLGEKDRRQDGGSAGSKKRWFIPCPSNIERY